MKLVILRNNHTNVFGGVEQKICSIVKRCTEEGIEVSVITTAISKDFINELSKNDIKIYRSEKINLFELVRLLRSIDPDILQTHQLIDGILTRFYKILTASRELKLVQRFHTHLDGYIDSKIKKKILMLLDKFTFYCVDDCLSISNALAMELSYLSLSDQKKIRVVENGTKLPRSRPRPRPEGFLYNTACIVGDISNRKNQIETLRLLEKQSQIKTIHLCGNVKDGLLQDLEKIIMESKVQIIKHGFLNNDELHKIYAQSAFLILLSKFEGVPTVLFEARFYGLIPIFSDAGASKDYILDGVDGFTLDQASFQTLPEILDKLKKDDFDRLSLQSYRAFKNNYYEHEMTSAFLKLYQSYFEYDKN